MKDLDDTPLIPSVLLVDDTPANLLALEAVLASLNAQIVSVRSGKAALGCVEHQTFAVALVDVHMPEMDGLELIRHLRATKRGREMAILLVTADHNDEKLVSDGYAVGAADYITKPYDPQVIRARVRAFIDLYRQRETVRRVHVALRTHERDEAIRRLVAFERITNAVLETNDLPSLLMELLGAFIGAADAADSATILLRDSNWLRIAASVGTAPNARSTVETQIGQGFAGLIASNRRALEITDDTSSSVSGPLSSTGQGSKVRALYGMPLLHSGQVLGVVQIGSTRAGRFSSSEKRVGFAAAERGCLGGGKKFVL